MTYDTAAAQAATDTDPGVRAWATALDHWIEHTADGRAWLAEQAAMDDERHGRSLWQGPRW